MFAWVQEVFNESELWSFTSEMFIFSTKVKYVGHAVFEDKVEPDPAKIAKVKNVSVPSSLE